MAYYRVEDREIPPPPDPPIASDADAHAKLAHRKEHERAVKEAHDMNKMRAKSIEDYASVVVDERSGKLVCVCEGPSHAHYIAGLLNDRPPR